VSNNTDVSPASKNPLHVVTKLSVLMIFTAQLFAPFIKILNVRKMLCKKRISPYILLLLTFECGHSNFVFITVCS
jgi:hypothetical protein